MRHKNDLTFNAKFNGKERFGFRKLSIGLATVALGTTFFLSNGQLVHADENNNQEPTSTEVEGATQSEEKQEVKVETQQATTEGNKEATQQTAPKSGDSSETSGATQSSTPKTDKATQGNASKIDSASTKDDQNNTTKETTNKLDISSLEKNKVDKTTLTDQKDNETPAEPSYSSTVTAQKRNSDGTSTDVTGKSQKMAADQDAVEVDTTVNLTDVKKVTKDNPIKVQIINWNTQEPSDVLHINDTINNSKGWHFEKEPNDDEKNDPLTFDAWYEGDKLPTSVTFRINVQARNEKVKEYLANHTSESSENLPVGVKITYPTGKVETQHAFDAQFITSQDTIQKNEILKGFRMGETTIEAEKGYGNISPKDVDKYKLDNANDTVLQWGLYFNYSGSLDPNNITTLENAIFSASFQNQIFLPDSIKVFEVPINCVSDGHGHRYGIDDKIGDKKVYDLIVTDSNRRYAFENYLKDNSNGENSAKSIENGFAIDQSKSGTFYVPSENGQKDESYSKHAYFIQVDTVVPSKNKGDGSLSSHIIQGTGENVTNHTVNWNNITDGSGDDTQNVQQAILRYYDDTTREYLDILTVSQM